MKFNYQKTTKIASWKLCPLLLLFLIFLNCSPSMIVKDDLPEGAPKGYVEFYSTWRQTEYYFDIYRIVNNIEIYEGKPEATLFALKRDTKWGFRLAKSPGLYTFKIKMKNAEQQIQIIIKKDMLTPVRIHTENVNRSKRQDGVIETSFTLEADIERSIPFPPEDGE